MNLRFPSGAFTGVLGVGFVLTLGAVINAAGGQAAQTTEDTGGNSPSAGGFPLAAPAGVDSNAINQAPPGAVNQGPLNASTASTWKYGHAFDAPPNAKIWNPVMIKMMKGEKVTGVSIGDVSPETYCQIANSGADFTWTEMQHNPRTWEKLGRLWAACPHAKAVPGVRLPLADEHAIQQAMDMGALVLVVPTVRSVEQAIYARDMAFFPPLGDRSLGGGQGFTPAFWGSVPGGYRDTINQNLVMIDMIETLPAAIQAKQIAAIPGVTAIFAASSDLGNRSGYKRGDPDYERLINVVHDAAIDAHKRLCGPYDWLNRPDFTCFQVGANANLGPLKNTQGRPEVGPFADKK